MNVAKQSRRQGQWAAMTERRWDMWVDFARVYEGGLTYGHVDDAEPGVAVTEGTYLIVGDDDAEPAVGQVVEVKPDGIVLLRVLPGHVDQHLTLLGPRSA